MLGFDVCQPFGEAITPDKITRARFAVFLVHLREDFTRYPKIGFRSATIELNLVIDLRNEPRYHRIAGFDLFNPFDN